MTEQQLVVIRTPDEDLRRFTVALSPDAVEVIDAMKSVSGSGSRSRVIEDAMDLFWDVVYFQAKLANAENAKEFSTLRSTLYESLSIKGAKYWAPYSDRLKEIQAKRQQSESASR